MNELPRNFFGAFIMTFERPEILLRSIRNLQSQTFPPEYILIVDNSASYDTRDALKELISPSLEYYRVGYNSGPAGGASLGLTKVAEKGYQWIYWGDDDNPPRNPQVFQELFSRIRKLEEDQVNLGIYGGKGGTFNKFTGRIRSLKNKDLGTQDAVEVDMVAGGQIMLVKAEVIQQNILPEERLFFGFEDLDFSLKVRAAGYEIFVDARSWLEARLEFQNSGNNYRPVDSSFGNEKKLLRDYYSNRNLLYILHKNKLYFPLSFQLLKSFAKMFWGFKISSSYGKKNFFFQKKAIQDFFKKDFSFKETPGKPQEKVPD